VSSGIGTLSRITQFVRLETILNTHQLRIISYVCNKIQFNFLCYAMLRKGRAKTKETRKIYAARAFPDKNDFALFKYPIKLMKLLIIFKKNTKQNLN
jgi:hypothetical protein